MNSRDAERPIDSASDESAAVRLVVRRFIMTGPSIRVEEICRRQVIGNGCGE